MATRAEIIVKVKSELTDLAGGVSVTDTAAAGNLFYYALNDALSQYGLGITDGDLTSITPNDVRIVSVGVQYFITRDLVKKFISTPRLDQDAVSRDKFSRLTELWRLLQNEWKDALSGADSPPEISRPAESIVTWGGPSDGSTYNSSEGNNEQRNSDEFYITEMGSDITGNYNDGE